jgi:uncharacterized DUF497 family protein
LEFEWDANKAETNLKKHGITFSEAASIFGDPLEVTISDPDHSAEEFRFISIGRSEVGQLLVVAYTERGNHIRIITARRAMPQEVRNYESGSKYDSGR